MENNDIDIQEILKNAKNDTSLFSNIDVNRLLKCIEQKKNEYLENKTIQNIIDENFDVIVSLGANKDETKILCDKLSEYRTIDKICDLHLGKHVRWIRRDKQPVKLTNGGIVMDIKFMDTGIGILVKNNMNNFIQYKFDECVTFQKLSTDEQLILMAYEYMLKK